MTEKCYVIKEDPNINVSCLQGRRCLKRSLIRGKAQQRRDIDHVLVQCWPFAGPLLKQHKGNVTSLLGGAHGANCSVTIQLDEGGDIVCIYLRLTLPLPQQLAIEAICFEKAVSAHL